MAKQAAAHAQRLQEAGESPRLSLNQKHQTQEITDLREAFKMLKAEHQRQVVLLQSRVDTLEKDKGVLEDRSKKVQEKNRNLMKEHKGNSLVFSNLLAAK